MEFDGDKRLHFIHVWFFPFMAIFVAFAVSFLFFMGIDYHGSSTNESFFGLFWLTEKDAASNILGSVAEVVAAILGIAITVVAIIVELAANRYTSRVTDLFIRDRVNFFVLGLFVTATLTCLWTASSIHQDFTPVMGVRWTLFLMTVSLLVLLPYFNYVFEFLQPNNIINRIRQQVFESLSKLNPTTLQKKIDQRKEWVMTAAEQITDIALNSILQKDRGLAMGSTLVLRSMIVDTLNLKSQMPDGWYEVSEYQRRNPDFVTLSEQGIQDLKDGKTWLEFKIFKQFNLIFAQSLNNLRDLNNLIAMCFRDIGISADKNEDDGARELTINFFNTIMRATLNGKDVRTGYNVLHQYRQFCSHLISVGKPDLVLNIFRYLKYYGLLFDSRGMGFILETVAYDLYRLTREASDKELGNEQKLLEVFLEVDRPPDPGSSDRHLRGVRKAQAMLAAYYIKTNKLDNVRQIAGDMSVEPMDRLMSIKDEILQAKRQFWEITDRGVNFDFVEPDLRDSLVIFFEKYAAEAKGKKASK
ncbi:MAG: DUF2254 domain-containing protein [Planctomycetota bacterium]|nr:DUF2254 domain-containing protein [Planctomycetota bacterium]